MNMLALAQLLANAGLGAFGESVFVGQMPSSAARAVMIRAPLKGVPVNHYLPGFYHGSFQLIARASTYDDGSALISQAIAALRIPAETMVGTMKVNYCRPMTLPVAFPLSTANLIEFSTNFEICFVDTVDSGV
jgi:hypothetical protein